MRILNLTAQFPGQTGSGTYLNAIINEAMKNGHEIGIIGATQDRLSYDRKDLAYLDLLEFNTKDIPFYIVGMSDVMPYESTKYKDMDETMLKIWEERFKGTIKKSIEEFKPDIILSHHLFLLTALACDFNLGIPIYAFCHGTDIRQYLSIDRYQNRLKESLIKLDGVFSLNYDQKNIINELYEIEFDKIHVVGGGYDEDVFYPPCHKEVTDEIRLVYAGKLSYAKGLIPLFKCIEELRSDYNLALYVAGSGAKEEEKEIRQLGNIDEIKFLGNLSQDKLADKFRETDIFVLPSYFEGLPLVVMEALACNLRIVVSNFKGLMDYIGEPLNNSGLINYVELPKELVLDRLNYQDEVIFMDKLKKSIEKSINDHLIGYNSFAPYKEEIREFSWEGVFKRIEKTILF